MNTNYWKDYWENYYKFMAVYLKELQNSRPNQDIKEEYLDVAAFLAPPIDTNEFFNFNYEDFYDDYLDNNENELDYADNGNPNVYVSPGGGKFAIENCKKMPILKIEMKKGYSPSKFYMIVDRYDKRSISGYRIACENNGRITFKALSLEYRDINLIECAF